MARELRFTGELFDTFMDGFLGTTLEQRDHRLAAKILDAIDTISLPKYRPDEIDKNQSDGVQLLLSQQRLLGDGPKAIILEEPEYHYAVRCVKAAGWKNWAAQRGVRMEDWLVAVKEETHDQIVARHQAESVGIIGEIKHA